MEKSSSLRAALVCVAGVAVLGVGMGAASGAKLKTKSETESADSGEVASPSPRCKRGTKALSGGWDAEVDISGPTAIFYPLTSARDGKRSWTAEGANTGSPGEMTGFAYCRDERVKTKSAATTVPVGQTESVAAKCPKGTKAVSGGFSTEFEPGAPGQSLIINEDSSRSGRREWTVTGSNIAGDDGTLTAQVNCREGKRLKTRQASELVSGPGPDQADITAKCKRRERVVSGGYTGPPLESGGALVEASHRVGKRGWKVSAITGATNTEEVTAFAYCEKT
jgi:hypothetical protein